ncbi:MAG: DUF2459 domain-containing protein, partial [Pseudomonadota bacterium]
MAALALFVLLVLLGLWIGSSIPRGAKMPDTPVNPVRIMVATNGVHTELVLPIVHRTKDWRETFPSAGEWINGSAPTHISIGFGEREVFLNTPTLADLDIITAARIAATGGEGLLRVNSLINPGEHKNRRALTIGGAQYQRLVETIESELPDLGSQGFRSYETGTVDTAPYYQSTLRYSILHSCNQWTSDRLSDAGIRTGWLTPFSGGVMK